MKKVLLSLAVIAASGAYVAYEGPFGGKAGVEADAAANAASLAAQPADVALPAPPASAAARPVAPSTATAAIPAVVVSVATPDAPVAVAASAAGQVSSPVAPAAPATDPAAAVPVPLPRSRPADAPVIVKAAQAASPAAYRDGTFKGSSADAYYGEVQVEAVIQGGKLVSVDVLSYPNDRRTSRYINGRALPELEQEAIQAQSANIDGVSGATLTSTAYEQSLDAALSAARTAKNNA